AQPVERADEVLGLGAGEGRLPRVVVVGHRATVDGGLQLPPGPFLASDRVLDVAVLVARDPVRPVGVDYGCDGSVTRRSRD
ncbi:MAG TPA: hypothetical protein VIQ02_18705, partial [Jiangellaceae bacterium]